MVSKEKINLLIISAIIVFALIIAYSIYAPSKHNLFVSNFSENIVNNNFNYMESSTSNSLKSRKPTYKDDTYENIISPSDFVSMNRITLTFH